MVGKAENDPIPSAVRELVSVFEQQLADVQFPGVGHSELSSLTEHVHENSTALDQARAQVAKVESGLAENLSQLLLKAEQALAYAKIYAASDPTLLSRLNAIKLGRATKKPVKVKAKTSNNSDPATSRKKAKKAMDELEQTVPVQAEPASN